jgi:hypothetical protein
MKAYFFAVPVVLIVIVGFVIVLRGNARAQRQMRRSYRMPPPKKYRGPERRQDSSV